MALRAGVAALEDHEYYRGQVERIVAERQRLIEALRHEGVRAYDSHGNFVAIDASTWPGGAWGFAASLRERRVIVRVLSEPLVRITIGTREENDTVLTSIRAMVQAGHQDVIGC
jgi:histidinol-phosphate aminotransferase